MDLELKQIEEAVIGAALVSSTAIDRIKLRDYHFTIESNIAIFKAMLELSQENKPIDIITVSAKCNGKFMLELATISTRVSSLANVEYHCTIILEKYAKRKVIEICQTSISKLSETGTDVFKIISETVFSFENLNAKSGKDFQEISQVVSVALSKIQKAQESDQTLMGLDIGFTAANNMLNGWQSPDLIILAARPGMGKTALALNFAANLIQKDIPVAMFSLEMSAEQLAKRLISNMTGVFSNYIKTATINEAGWTKIHSTDFNKPLYIDDTAGIGLTELKEKARKVVKNNAVELIIVDYLQLVNAYGIKNREEQISLISRSLKGLAKELNIPIIALAQLSRDVEKRGGKPRLSDLRESGAIEQDADIVGFIHSESDGYDNPAKDIQEVEVIIAKHRNGETGFFKLNFEKSKSKFHNIN
jgi:replicative DNA helicase